MKITLTQVHVQPVAQNALAVQVQGIDAEGNTVVYTHTMPIPKLEPEEPKALLDAVKFAILSPANGDPS